MQNSKDLLTWWLSKDGLSSEEDVLIHNVCTMDKKFVDEGSYKKLEDEYFERLPFGNIDSDGYDISFSKKATDLIVELFRLHVDDDTLVISSDSEHDNVKKCLSGCKNRLILTDLTNVSMNNILVESKKYKKVFVYIIGTQISNGRITPQNLYIELKELFIKNGIEHIMVIDDVHGMFIIPRDYSIFDYIIFTAHALVLNYSMGMLISRKGLYRAESIYNWGSDYLPSLDIVLKRQEKLRMFNYVMSEYFYFYLKSNDYKLFPNVAPHIFSLIAINKNFTEDMCQLLKPYQIKVEYSNQKYTFLRFRAAQYISDPDLLLPGLDKLETILDLF